MVKFSCLITVYSGTVLQYFSEAIDSILQQSVKPDELLIVVDGPVLSDLEHFIDNLLYRELFEKSRKISMEKNIGAGPARNLGIEQASYEWVAIMDCDDVSLSNRFEKQLEIISKFPHVDLVCSLSDEYMDVFNEENYISTKKCPRDSEAIKRRLNYNCCITNPTIFFRKRLWKETNGYASFRYLNEDHLFFLKAAKQNFTFYCIQETLLKVRIGKEQRKRRSGWKLFMTDFHFRYHCFKNDLIDFKGFMVLVPLLIRRFTPFFLLSYAHKVWRSV